MYNKTSVKVKNRLNGGFVLRKEKLLNVLSQYFCVLIVPVYTVAVQSAYLPDYLRFIRPQINGELPLFLQFILLDVIFFAVFRLNDIKGKYSLLLCTVVAIMIGRLTVNVGWAVHEAVLLLSIVCLFSEKHSNRVRLLRIFIVLITPMLGLWSIPLGIMICSVCFLEKK